MQNTGRNKDWESMSGFVEIEKRYQLLDNDLSKLLKEFTYVGEKRVVDEYFDTKDGFYYQEGIFIRIRNKQDLDIKFNPEHLGKKDINDHVYCHEYSFQEPFKETEREKFNGLAKLIKIYQPSRNTFESFIKENNLMPLLVVDKIRTTYVNELYTCVVDDIKDNGLFLEIEYSGPQGKDRAEILSQMDSFMNGIFAKPLSTGVFEIILRQQNFKLYKKGKYLLEEDVEKNVA